MDEIQEWTATLKCNKYDKPSHMKLTGEVNGIKVEMSFDTLRKLAKYDNLPARDYTIPSLNDLFIKPKKHPRWNDMLAALFLPGTYSGTLYQRNLKIIAKLLLTICILNVIPRRGDTQEMRYHKLKSEGQRWRALKADARALLPGEEDEPESEDEPPSGDKDYADEPHGENVDVGQGGPSRGHGGAFFDYTERSYEPNWEYDGTMQEVIKNQRPLASVFDTWSGSERIFFDHQIMMGASMERALKQNMLIPMS
ncbi:hypothetical protein Hanom_Chr09g00786701 [Helianthus anomalus]